MKRGFTLIELLIVIGVLAILSTTVTLIINPANLLREARDIQRVTDLQTVKKAIDFYITRSGSINLDATTPGICDDPSYVSSPVDGSRWYASGVFVVGSGVIPAGRQPFLYPIAGGPIPVSGIVPEATLRNVDGNGWVPVNLFSASGGPAISKLPVDPNPDLASPLTTTGRYYAYRCEGFRYELNANMESSKYGNGGGKDVEATDGGILGCSGNSTDTFGTRCTQAKAYLIFEIGNDPDLNL